MKSSFIVVCLQLVVVGVACAQDVVHIASEDFDAYIALEEDDLADSAKWAEWVAQNASTEIPRAEGTYLIYSIETGDGPYTVFVGPYDGARSPHQDRTVLLSELASSAVSDPELLRGTARVIDGAQLQRIRDGGLDNWARSQALARARAHASMTQWAGDVAATNDLPMSALRRQQLIAARDSQLTGEPAAGMYGLTLGEADAIPLDRALGAYLAGKTFTQRELTVLRQNGVTAADTEMLLASSLAYFEEVQGIDLETHTWAKEQFKQTLQPQNVPESYTAEQFDVLLRSMGRLLPAIAERQWGSSPGELLAPTPSLRKLERASNHLREFGDSEVSDIIDRYLPPDDSIRPDHFDLGALAFEGLQEDREPVSDGDVRVGRDALVKGAERFDEPSLTDEALEKALAEGASNEDVQAIADVTQKLIGTLPMISAIGSSSNSPSPDEWSAEEVRELIGRIGIAERRSRLVDALEAELETDVDLHKANEEGVNTASREDFERALGELAGAQDPESAQTSGERILEEAGAPSSGDVTAAQAQQAIDAAAGEGSKEAGGEPGESTGGSDGGSGGPIPVKSLPVLEFLTRLLAQYFGVEAYLRQAALMCYLFAPDLVNDLVSKLEAINDEFGDDLQDLAQDGNKLLNELGPVMGDVGALAEAAVDKGFEQAARELGELALEDFKEAKIQELRERIAEELKIDAGMLDLVDLETALSLPDDFDLEVIAETTKDQLQQAALESAGELLADVGVPLNLDDTGNPDWATISEAIVEKAKADAIDSVITSAGLSPEMTALASEGRWDELGEVALSDSESMAYEAASQATGLPIDFLKDPSSQPEEAERVTRSAGAYVNVFGEQVDTSINELAAVTDENVSRIVQSEIQSRVGAKVQSLPDGPLRAALETVESEGLSDDVLARAAELIIEDARSNIDRNRSSWEALLELGRGQLTSQEIEVASEQLAVLGVLPNLPHALTKAPAEGTEVQVFEQELIGWYEDRIEFGFTPESGCYKALMDGLNGERLQRPCAQWLNSRYGGSEKTIEDTLVARRFLLDRVQDDGDRAALIQSMYQHAISTVDDSMPVPLSPDVWRQIDRANSVDGIVRAWAEESAGESVRELRAITDYDTSASLLKTLSTGDFDSAAETIIRTSQESASAENAYPEEIKRILNSEKPRGQIKQELVAHLDKSTMEQGVAALSNDRAYGLVGQAIGCAVEGEDCAQTFSDLREQVVDQGLEGQTESLKRAVIAGDSKLASGILQAEMASETAKGLGTDAVEACANSDSPNCLVVEGSIVPKVKEAIPGITSATARSLISAPRPDLSTLKDVAGEVATSDQADTFFGDLGVEDPAQSLGRFASKPSILDDPSARRSALESVISESYRSVLGESPSKELIDLMVGGGAQVSQPQCVDIVVRAFIPSDELSNNNPIFKVPGKKDQWMIPGPMAIFAGYNGEPTTKAAEESLEELGQDEVGFLQTCYLGDSRTFESPKNKSATSRVSLSFTMRTGEFGASIDPSGVNKLAHATQAVDCVTGAFGDSEAASTDFISLSMGQSDLGAGLAVATVKVRGKNPLVPALFSPLLEVHGTFTYSPADLTLRFSGRREGFPAYEAYARLNGGDWQTVFRAAPEKGASAFSILDLGVADRSDAISAAPVVFAGQSNSCSINYTHKEQVARVIHDYLNKAYALNGDLSNSVRIERALSFATEAREAESKSQDLVLRDAEYYLHGLYAGTSLELDRVIAVSGAPVYDAFKYVAHELADQGYHWLEKQMRATEDNPTSPPGGWRWAYSGMVDSRRIKGPKEVPPSSRGHRLILDFQIVD